MFRASPADAVQCLQRNPDCASEPRPLAPYSRRRHDSGTGGITAPSFAARKPNGPELSRGRPPILIARRVYLLSRIDRFFVVLPPFESVTVSPTFALSF
jgi:hypothetical protein